MKKLLIVGFASVILSLGLFSPVKAQEMSGEYRSLLLQLIALLTKQVEVLQAQLVAQQQTNTIMQNQITQNQAVVPTPETKLGAIEPELVKDLGISREYRNECAPQLIKDTLVKINFWCSYVGNIGQEQDIKIEITFNGETKTTGPGKLQNIQFDVPKYYQSQPLGWTVKMTKGNKYTLLSSAPQTLE